MPQPPDAYRLVLSTAGSDEQAETIARALVERRLAACVNIVHGVCSFYRWKGELQRDSEQLLVIKTVAGKLEELKAAVHELHSYETPEIIALPIEDGDAGYLKWLSDGVAPGD